MKSIFYGSIYDDEKNDFIEIVENQFKRCSNKARKDGMEIVTWGFDILVKDEKKKSLIETWVDSCAKRYFPNVPNVSKA